ncbi:DUF4129 domain-containing protein [Microbacterium halophytorum]|uniref:DUF4129 domain-containing protein n=1 Tax=Microbacterium halophytorum TaxID=2067568 RepID=UPI000CFAEEFA|nr:DUF4129 domain-containing protein [Microbacterium halophytorum]
MTLPLIAPFALPDQPGPDEARRLAEDELSRRVYDEAQPSFLDRIALAISDFFDSLVLRGVGEAWSPIVVVLVLCGLAALIAVGLVVWGRPKLAHRQRSASALLFGEDDVRPAAELRRDAEAHAAAGRWEQAIADRFRALARALEERDVLDPVPGLTAHGMAEIAAEFFPQQAAVVRTGASHFDDVRYLRRPGTAAMYSDVARADDDVAGARPAMLAPAFGAAP